MPSCYRWTAAGPLPHLVDSDFWQAVALCRCVSDFAGTAPRACTTRRKTSRVQPELNGNLEGTPDSRGLN